jgi:hypothetical protein
VWTPDWVSVLVVAHKEGDGVIYSGHCYVRAGHGDWYDTPVWFPSVTTPPTAAQLLTQAEAKLHMTGAQIQMAPSPGGMGLVGMPVWLSTQVNPQTWGPQTVTVSAGGVTLTAAATGTAIAWDMGDGHTVTCQNPGNAYNPAFGLDTSHHLCGYTYAQPSGGQPGNAYKVTATTTWQIVWRTTTGASGTVTPARTTVATASIKIGEVQAVNQ